MAETLCLQEDLQNPQVSVEVIVQKVRRFQVHQLNRNRSVTGEFFHIFPAILDYPDKVTKYLRMSKDTYLFILKEIKPHLQKNWCNFHTQPIYPDQRLVLTIRFLATGLSYSDLAFSFSMGVSTVCTIIKETMGIIWEVLGPQAMPHLTKQKLLDISDEFYAKRKFPHCLGAVDSKHVRVKKPAHSKSSFYNYKKFYSIKFQAVADSNSKFMCIDVGSCGSEHDAKTYRNSSFYQALHEGIIELPKPDKMPDSDIVLPYYFIGDGAYPLMETLLKPYRGRNLPIYKEKYNNILSHARVVVECAFGILCKKWKIFRSNIEHSPETVNLIIKCTCVLHNIIIDRDKLVIRNESQEERLRESAREVFGTNTCDDDSFLGNAKKLQQKVMKYLWYN